MITVHIVMGICSYGLPQGLSFPGKKRYIVMAYIVMAYIVMAYIVIAYVVMAFHRD